jgi:hypothetical protein
LNIHCMITQPTYWKPYRGYISHQSTNWKLHHTGSVNFTGFIFWGSCIYCKTSIETL